MDLGANGWQTFRYVVLPNLSSALLAGGMLAFALSFDEIIVTTFTAGHERTLPLWLLNQLGRPRGGTAGYVGNNLADPGGLVANPRRRQWSITTDTGICYAT